MPTAHCCECPNNQKQTLWSGLKAQHPQVGPVLSRLTLPQDTSLSTLCFNRAGSSLDDELRPPWPKSSRTPHRFAAGRPGRVLVHNRAASRGQSVQAVGRHDNVVSNTGHHF